MTSNPVVFFEIPVLDLDRAVRFYHAVFGYEFTRTAIDGNEMALFPYSETGGGVSGALAQGETYVPSRQGALLYFKSDDLTGTLQRVGMSGGLMLYPPTSIGDLGMVAEFEDSEGNRIGLHFCPKSP